MKQLVDTIQAFALAIGGPGLFLVAFLDSSFLSLPQANDLLVVYMVLQNPALMPFYVVMATLGSVCGCLTLYFLARKGGDAFLRRRLSERHIDRAMRMFQRHGVLAVFVPSLLPPPAPFKLFVLASGIAAIPAPKFALAIAAGRGLRYFGLGLLTLWYGEAALDYLNAHRREVAWLLFGAVIAGLVVYFWWRARRRRVSSRDLVAPGSRPL